MPISIETHITCDFPGGIRTPYHPSGSAHEGKASYTTGQVRIQRSFANFCLSYNPFLTEVWANSKAILAFCGINFTFLQNYNI